MSNFKTDRFQVKSEDDNTQVRVVKSEDSYERTVAEFELPRLQSSGQGSYQATKTRFGALAATDPDHKNKGRKDSRFSLNPLQKDPLSVEEEERRIIEERVAERVAAVAEEARKKGAVEGYRDGLAKGHEEAFENFKTEAAGRMERLESLVNQLENAKTEIFQANERFLVDLVYRIGRAVLLRELKTDRQYVLRLARDLIERVGVRENITIRIHPDDLDTAGMLREGLEKSLGALKNLNIEATTQVARGGCHVETEWNAIDASIETQLKGLFEALIGSEDKGEGGTSDPAPASGGMGT